MGWDLTFSAPKSVSIAWGFADSPHRRDILEAHQAAAKAAFGYMEANTTTRRGYAGLLGHQLVDNLATMKPGTGLTGTGSQRPSEDASGKRPMSNDSTGPCKIGPDFNNGVTLKCQN